MDIKEEVKEAVSGLEKQVKAALATVTDQVKDAGKATEKDRAELKSLVADLEGVVKQLSKLEDDITGIAQKGVKGELKTEQKSVGIQFIESKQFKEFAAGQTTKARLEMKNTILNSGNETSVHDQLPGLVEGAFRQLSIMPTIMQGQVNSNIVYYSRELGWTNNAAGQTEGSAKPESDLTFEEVNTPIQTIAHWLKLSKQSLEDSTFLASYVDRLLRHGVMNITEFQIVNGDGTGNEFSGWAKSGNSVVVDPIGTTDIFGLTNKMYLSVIAADFMPDFFYFNPLDWGGLETVRRSSSDAGFVGAAGAVNYVNNGQMRLLWGIPVVLSNNIPSGLIYCKSFDADMYADRQATAIEMFDQDGTNAQSNLITVRAENRGAALNFRPAAIVSGLISGITAPA